MSEDGYILDASALLALMLDEPGAEAVQAALPLARISTVNLSEVVSKLQERGVPDDIIVVSFIELGIETVPFEYEQAIRAGLLRQATRHVGLSLGDRACLAAADSKNATAITTDRAWSDLDLGIKIQVAR